MRERWRNGVGREKVADKNTTYWITGVKGRRRERERQQREKKFAKTTREPCGHQFVI
jgi:hypothetical protein